MILTKENIVDELKANDVIIQSYLYRSKNNKYWKLRKAVTVQLSNNDQITIPEGFVYDMATSPKVMWSIVRPYNDSLFAYLVHDYLYIKRKSLTYTRKQADLEMLYWCMIINNNHLDNYIRYFFVRAFGWYLWNK